MESHQSHEFDVWAGDSLNEDKLEFEQKHVEISEDEIEIEHENILFMQPMWKCQTN